jgi:PIN domain nuclease of toxin-antitoxin system
MIYVTDTHALVLFASGSVARMSCKCVQIFRRAEQQRDSVDIPVACFLELATLLERGRVKSSLSFDDWHDRVAQFPGLPIEPLVWQEMREASGLAALVDPFDHGVSANASKTQPAKLLAVFVVDTNETELTIPFGK